MKSPLSLCVWVYLVMQISWGKNIPDKVNSKHKNPKDVLICLRNSKKSREATVKWKKGQEVGFQGHTQS